MPVMRPCRQCQTWFMPESVIVGNTEMETDLCRVCRALAMQEPDTYRVRGGGG